MPPTDTADGAPTRVLFVCLGNICRSPQAQAIFEHIVRERGLEDRYEADSCGTAAYHVGDPPDPRSVAEAAANGVTMDHQGRQLKAADLDRFDLLLCMDASNLRNAQRLVRNDTQRAKIRLMRAYEPPRDPGRHAQDAPDVPDPYYGGKRGFSEVFDILERSCESLLARLEAGER